MEDEPSGVGHEDLGNRRLMDFQAPLCGVTSTGYAGLAGSNGHDLPDPDTIPEDVVVVRLVSEKLYAMTLPLNPQNGIECIALRIMLL
jgi:hypothetical protein